MAPPLLKKVVPRRHAGARLRGKAKDVRFRRHGVNVGFEQITIDIEMRQEIDPIHDDRSAPRKISEWTNDAKWRASCWS